MNQRLGTSPLPDREHTNWIAGRNAKTRSGGFTRALLMTLLRKNHKTGGHMVISLCKNTANTPLTPRIRRESSPLRNSPTGLATNGGISKRPQITMPGFNPWTEAFM